MASLTAYSGREAPQAVTRSDLRKFAAELTDAVFSPDLAVYSITLFTVNGRATNPSTKEPVRKARVAQFLNRLADEPGSLPAECVYCGRPALLEAYRDLVPMMSGRDQPNFFPHGRPGLPTCPLCLLCLQALLIGSPMCSGRALVVVPDDRDRMIDLAAEWIPQQRSRVQLSGVAGRRSGKLLHPLTRSVEALVELERRQRSGEWRSGVTVYHLTNGQTPTMNIHRLPLCVARFVIRARAAAYRDKWDAAVASAWEQVAARAARKRGEPSTRVKGAGIPATSSSGERSTVRNWLYEDLFTLPEASARFIRVYFLRRAVRSARRGIPDPRTSYDPMRDAASISWGLTELFLKEVVGMERRRVQAIQSLADRIAEDVVGSDDRKFFSEVYYADRYPHVRNVLIRHSKLFLERYGAPLITLEDFLLVFEEGNEVARVDWQLAWDLVLIRLLEQLSEKGWLQKNADAVRDRPGTDVTETLP